MAPEKLIDFTILITVFFIDCEKKSDEAIKYRLQVFGWFQQNEA